MDRDCSAKEESKKRRKTQKPEARFATAQKIGRNPVCRGCWIAGWARPQPVQSPYFYRLPNPSAWALRFAWARSAGILRLYSVACSDCPAAQAAQAFLDVCVQVCAYARICACVCDTLKQLGQLGQLGTYTYIYNNQ